MSTAETETLYPGTTSDPSLNKGMLVHEKRLLDILDGPQEEWRTKLVYPTLADVTHYGVYKGAQATSQAEANRVPFALSLNIAVNSFRIGDEEEAESAINFWAHQFDLAGDEQDPTYMLAPNEVPLALAARQLIADRDRVVFVDPEIMMQKHQDTAGNLALVLEGVHSSTPLEKLYALQWLRVRQDALSLVDQLRFQSSEDRTALIDLLTRTSDTRKILEESLTLFDHRQRHKLFPFLAGRKDRIDPRYAVLSVFEQTLSCIPSPI